MSSLALEIAAPSNDTSIPDLDFEEMDIHGKLAVLNAIDLSHLTLTNRCAMILLSGPWCSDELGRFMGSPGFLPELSALSKRQTSMALRALTEKELVKTWMIGGTQCWEVAGAYAFKKNRKAAFNERRMLARIKRETRENRKNRRQEEFQGESYLDEDDGSPNADGVVDVVRTKGGGHVPMRPTMFYRSKVPTPENSGKYKLIVPQPKNENDCNLHLYPSFNVYAGLSELGVVIRHHLLQSTDNYGRVRIDISSLYSELGVAITKRVSMKDIEREINRMSTSGHLLVFQRPSGTYAYIRDAAQHLKKKMIRNMKLPKLVDDGNFTHDSDLYNEFFETCRGHATKRDKVYLHSHTKEGIVYAFHDFVEVAAERFREKFHELMSSERYAAATPDTIHEVNFDAGWERLNDVELFYYGYLNKMSCQWMESFYQECDRKLSDPNENYFKILRYLMKMTPQEYLQKLRDEALGESATATG